MSLLTPGRRWQPPFFPFKNETFPKKTLAFIERITKGPVFGCRMCGNCLLQETAFICPMECPKGLRNGPCGGSVPGKCYVDESRPCIWYAIFDSAFKMGREEKLMEVLPPMDWEKAGTETWGDVFKQIHHVGWGKVTKGLLTNQQDERTQTWESIFQPIRQPDWWKGDSEYHAPALDGYASNLQKQLMSGEFVITAEVTPPLTVATSKFFNNLEMVKPFVSAVNFTDSPSATPRMSSWACSSLATQKGVEPVMQIAARDRTRVGLQAEAIGANALGIRNYLCISGDSMVLNPGPRGRMDIVDLDSIQMLWILRRMRDEGKYLDGREIKYPPKYFLGAAASPMASEIRFQALREEKKINAGAQFFQTNVVFDIDKIETWINELGKRNVLDKVFILIGITPLKSLKMATYMIDEVPGVFVPEAVLKRMEKAEMAGNAPEEGVQIALELMTEVKRLNGQGVNGIHIMAVGWEEIVPRLIQEAGLAIKKDESEGDQ